MSALEYFGLIPTVLFGGFLVIVIASIIGRIIDMFPHRGRKD